MFQLVEIKFLQKLVQQNNFNKRQTYTHTKMNHNTFSMQNVLNQPIDPILCKRILQEIKSPILQQSFAMTNDESLSHSWINVPKRPNIPPPSQNSCQKRRPLIKNIDSSYSNSGGKNFIESSSKHNNNLVYSEDNNFIHAITNRFECLQLENKGTLGNNTIQKPVQIGLVVSPLHPNITLRKPEDEPTQSKTWGRFCGNLFDKHQERQTQIEYNDFKAKFQRKKIFDQKTSSILKKLQRNPDSTNRRSSILLKRQQPTHIEVHIDEQEPAKEKSISQVIKELKTNRYVEVGDFIQFICTVINLLVKAQNERQFIINNLPMVYQLSNAQENQYSGSILSEGSLGKFFKRMNFSSVSDMLRKISRKKFMENTNSITQYNQHKNAVAQSLQKMLFNFSQVEKAAEEYLRLPNAIQSIQKVYLILVEKFTNQFTISTRDQIINLLNDLALFTYVKSVHQLEYIWDDFESELLSECEFINRLARTDGLYRKENRDMEAQLSSLGFVKN